MTVLHDVDGQGLTPQEFRAYQRDKGRQLLEELKQPLTDADPVVDADPAPAVKPKKRG